jgi:uncharacterized membrane protein
VNSRWRNIVDAIRSSYWFVPLTMVASGILFAFVMVSIDGEIDAEPRFPIHWGFYGGPAGARAVVTTIAGSMITVAGLVFSIAIVVLNLASSQFGPRMLRTFMSDVVDQIALGTFLATFAYCLIVLRAIRHEDPTTFVPHLSITLAVVMAIASLAVLVVFFHHISTSIQAASIIATIGRDLDNVVDRLFPEVVDSMSAESDKHDDHWINRDEPGTAVLCQTTGYITAIDISLLTAIAVKHDLLVRVAHMTGGFVVPGTPLLKVWPPSRLEPNLSAALHACLVVESERSHTHDVEFPIAQLVQFCQRCLSPALNDTVSAAICLDRLGSALCRLVERPSPEHKFYDVDGKLRVVTPWHSFEKILDAAIDPIREFATSSPVVTVRLLEAILTISRRAESQSHRMALQQHTEIIMRAVDRLIIEPIDREKAERIRRAIEAQLADPIDQSKTGNQADELEQDEN